MRDQFTLKLNSPITEEQWDAITDVDFDHTEEIFFHTKHGKDVTFVKQKKGNWIEESRSLHYCSECGWALMDGPGGEPPFIGMEFNRANRERRYVSAGWIESEMNYCPNCGADMRGDADETD